MSWWRRGRDGTSPGGTTAAPRPAPAAERVPGAWADLPALHRTVGEMPSVAPVQPFSASLRSWQSPGLVGALGHVLNPQGPVGVVEGLVEPAGRPVALGSAALLPVGQPRGRTGSRVQRQVPSGTGGASDATARGAGPTAAPTPDATDTWASSHLDPDAGTAPAAASGEGATADVAGPGTPGPALRLQLSAVPGPVTTAARLTVAGPVDLPPLTFPVLPAPAPRHSEPAIPPPTSADAAPAAPATPAAMPLAVARAAAAPVPSTAVHGSAPSAIGTSQPGTRPAEPAPEPPPAVPPLAPLLSGPSDGTDDPTAVDGLVATGQGSAVSAAEAAGAAGTSGVADGRTALYLPEPASGTAADALPGGASRMSVPETETGPEAVSTLAERSVPAPMPLGQPLMLHRVTDGAFTDDRAAAGARHSTTNGPTGHSLDAPVRPQSLQRLNVQRRAAAQTASRDEDVRRDNRPVGDMEPVDNPAPGTGSSISDAPGTDSDASDPKTDTPAQPVVPTLSGSGGITTDAPSAAAGTSPPLPVQTAAPVPLSGPAASRRTPFGRPLGLGAPLDPAVAVQRAVPFVRAATGTQPIPSAPVRTASVPAETPGSPPTPASPPTTPTLQIGSTDVAAPPVSPAAEELPLQRLAGPVTSPVPVLAPLLGAPAPASPSGGGVTGVVQRLAPDRPVATPGPPSTLAGSPAAPGITGTGGTGLPNVPPVQYNAATGMYAHGTAAVPSAAPWTAAVPAVQTVRDPGSAAVAAGIARRDTDGSVVFALPAPRAAQGTASATVALPVQRDDAAPAEPVPTPAPDLSAAPAPEPTAATSAPVPGAAAAAPSGADLEELARRLFDPLTARLKAELRLDRERAGLVTDLRR